MGKAPVWTGAPTNLLYASGLQYNFGQFASDPQSDPLSFSLVAPVPAGYSVHPQTGVVTFATAAITGNLTIRADNGQFYSDHTCTVYLQNNIPVWSDSLPSSYVADTSEPFSVTFTAADIDNDPIVFIYAPVAGLNVEELVQSGPNRSIRVWSDGLSNGTYAITVSLANSLPLVINPDLVIPIPVMAKPAKGVPFLEPSFNTNMVRITDASAEVPLINGLRTNYSQQQIWNADETLILLVDQGIGADYVYGGFYYIIDANPPYAVLKRRPTSPPGAAVISPGTGKWSPTDPRSFYYISYAHNVGGTNWNGFTPHNNAVVVKTTFDVNFNQTWKIVASFPTYQRIVKNPSSEEIAYFGADAWCGICISDVGETGNKYAFALNLTQSEATSANVMSVWIDLQLSPFSNEPDYVKVTRTCDQIILAWGDDDFGNTQWRGRELWNFDGTYYRQIDPTNDHGDQVYDGTNQYVVYAGNSSPGYCYRRAKITGPVQENIRILDIEPVTVVGGGQHISGTHLTPKPWVIQDSNWFEGNGWHARRDEINLFYLDSTEADPHIIRLAHTRQIYQNPDSGSPLATVNRSGTKVAFSTAWGGYPNDVYLIDIPSGSTTPQNPRSISFTVDSPSNNWPILSVRPANGQWSAPNVVGNSTRNSHPKYGRSPFYALDQSQSTRDILDWPGPGMWDPDSGAGGSSWIMGGGINTSGTERQTMTMVRYDVASDTFEPWQGSDFTRGLWSPYAEAHHLGGADIDLAGRRIIRMMAPHTNSTLPRIGSFFLDAPSDHANPTVATPAYDGSSGHGQVVFFPGRGILDFRRESKIRVLNATTANLIEYLFPTNYFPASNPTAAYHKGRNCVYFTAGYYTGYTNLRMYRINLTGGVTELTDPCPEPMSGGYGTIYYGSVWCILGDYIYAFCATGNIWRFNTLTETWDDAPVGSLTGADLWAGFDPTTIATPFNSRGWILFSTFCAIESANCIMRVYALSYNNVLTHLWSPP